MRQAQHKLDGTLDCWSGSARARRYDRQVNRRFYETALARLLQDAAPAVGRGLDLGCGTGFSLEVLRARLPAVDWEGVDASAAMLEVARRKAALATVDLTVADAGALPFPDATFDVVVANFAWHWFGERAGREVRRVLRPQGWLWATVPLRQRASATGNRLLARALLAQRQRFSVRSSQGLRGVDAGRVLPPPAQVARNELVVERERFADGDELLDVLDSRGALAAIFGEHPPARIAASGPVDFEWPYAVVHVQRRD
jgi:SAM-dependent methyltransferase